MTISVGTACSESVPGTQNESELFILADRALSAAKQEGRDRAGHHWELALPVVGPDQSKTKAAGAAAVASLRRGRIIVVDDDSNTPVVDAAYE